MISKEKGVQINISCESCESDYMILHDMDDNYYHVECCPFCSEELDEDSMDKIID